MTTATRSSREENMVRLHGKEAACPTCGKTFISIPNPRNRTAYRTYCSNACYYNSQRVHQPTKAILEELYINRQMPERDVCKQVNRSIGVVHGLLVQYGIPLRTKSESHKLAIIQGRACRKLRERSPFWKGDSHRYEDRYGYIWVRKPENYPYKHGKHAMIQEHILVWEQSHNQQLPEGWSVHHINGVKRDNKPRNLLGVPSNSEHKRQETNLLHERLSRIVELEAEVDFLKRALESHQGIFYFSES